MGSVVCKDIPPYSIVGGHPAIPFEYRDEAYYIQMGKKKKYY